MRHVQGFSLYKNLPSCIRGVELPIEHTWPLDGCAKNDAGTREWPNGVSDTQPFRLNPSGNGTPASLHR